MPNLQKIIKVTQTQYDTLAAGGTVGSYTGLNDNYLYLVPKQGESSMVFLTYERLKTLRSNNQLVPGWQYRIVDYQCTTTQSNTSSAGHQFDIIVTADDTDKLNEMARAALHSGDTYFSGRHLEAWQLWYSFDNNPQRFAWIDSDGKGVIYRMIDEFNNDIPYDFQNIRFTQSARQAYFEETAYQMVYFDGTATVTTLDGADRGTGTVSGDTLTYTQYGATHTAVRMSQFDIPSFTNYYTFTASNGDLLTARNIKIDPIFSHGQQLLNFIVVKYTNSQIPALSDCHFSDCEHISLIASKNSYVGGALSNARFTGCHDIYAALDAAQEMMQDCRFHRVYAIVLTGGGQNSDYNDCSYIWGNGLDYSTMSFCNHICAIASTYFFVQPNCLINVKNVNIKQSNWFQGCTIRHCQYMTIAGSASSTQKYLFYCTICDIRGTSTNPKTLTCSYDTSSSTTYSRCTYTSKAASEVIV